IVFDVVKSGRPATSQLLVGAFTGRQTVLLAFPVRDETDTVVGVLNFGLDLPGLSRLFADLVLPRRSTVTLADRNGRVLARNVEAEKFIGASFETPVAEPGAVPRTFVGAGPDGIERFYGNAVVARGPWLLSVAIPRSEVLARLAPLWQRNLVILAIAVLSVMALAVWISAQIAVDLRRLRRTAQSIAEGDFSPPSPSAA